MQTVELRRITSRVFQTQPRPDDNSSYAHRQLIGYIGLSLPLILTLVAGERNPDGPDKWQALDSISAYYYSGAVVPFVGLLVALSLFLLTYRGYNNEYQWADRAAATIGGLAALGVAYFPAAPPANVPPPHWWTPVTGILHYSFALVLLSAFAVFSLWLFRMRSAYEPITPAKRVRDQIHLMCGLTIVVAIVWTGARARAGLPIIIPESIALAAFAVSWLIKGRAEVTIAAAARAFFI